MKKPTCQTCAYYDPEASIRVYDIGGGLYPSGSCIPTPKYEKGGCRRYPNSAAHKTPDDFCGEHYLFSAYIASLTKDA